MLAADLAVLELDPSWTTFGGFLDAVEGQALGINVAFLVGHGTVRGAVLGSSGRAPDEGELAAMVRHVDEALDAGAAGVSSGLIYLPGLHADPAEVAAVVAPAGRRGRLYATHMRNESAGVLAAIDEAISTAAGRHGARGLAPQGRSEGRLGPRPGADRAAGAGARRRPGRRRRPVPVHRRGDDADDDPPPAILALGRGRAAVAALRGPRRGAPGSRDLQVERGISGLGERRRRTPAGPGSVISRSTAEPPGVVRPVARRDRGRGAWTATRRASRFEVARSTTASTVEHRDRLHGRRRTSSTILAGAVDRGLHRRGGAAARASGCSMPARAAPADVRLARPGCSARTCGTAASMPLETAVAKLSGRAGGASSGCATGAQVREGWPWRTWWSCDPGTRSRTWRDVRGTQPGRPARDPATSSWAAGRRCSGRRGDRGARRPPAARRRLVTCAARVLPRRVRQAVARPARTATGARTRSAGRARARPAPGGAAPGSARRRRDGAGRHAPRLGPRPDGRVDGLPGRARGVAPASPRPAGRRPQASSSTGRRSTTACLVSVPRGAASRARPCRRPRARAGRRVSLRSAPTRPTSCSCERADARPAADDADRPRGVAAGARRARTLDARRRSRHAAVAPAWQPTAISVDAPRHRAAGGAAASARGPACRSRGGSILAPPQALDTVVGARAVAHLRVFGHGPRFWALVAAGGSRTTPPWRRWLRRPFAPELHAALDAGGSAPAPLSVRITRDGGRASGMDG